MLRTKSTHAHTDTRTPSKFNLAAIYREAIVLIIRPATFCEDTGVSVTPACASVTFPFSSFPLQLHSPIAIVLPRLLRCAQQAFYWKWFTGSGQVLQQPEWGTDVKYSVDMIMAQQTFRLEQLWKVLVTSYSGRTHWNQTDHSTSWHINNTDNVIDGLNFGSKGDFPFSNILFTVRLWPVALIYCQSATISRAGNYKNCLAIFTITKYQMTVCKQCESCSSLWCFVRLSVWYVAYDGYKPGHILGL